MNNTFIFAWYISNMFVFEPAKITTLQRLRFVMFKCEICTQQYHVRVFPPIVLTESIGPHWFYWFLIIFVIFVNMWHFYILVMTEENMASHCSMLALPRWLRNFCQSYTVQQKIELRVNHIVWETSDGDIDVTMDQIGRGVGLDSMDWSVMLTWWCPDRTIGGTAWLLNRPDP